MILIGGISITNKFSKIEIVKDPLFYCTKYLGISVSFTNLRDTKFKIDLLGAYKS